jgi:hypothetical protein
MSMLAYGLAEGESSGVGVCAAAWHAPEGDRQPAAE